MPVTVPPTPDRIANLAAKPILDLVLAVPDAAEEAADVPAMETLGTCSGSASRGSPDERESSGRSATASRCLRDPEPGSPLAVHVIDAVLDCGPGMSNCSSCTPLACPDRGR
jgi:hypothetical protein